jgi:hypothetical protein
MNSENIKHPAGGAFLNPQPSRDARRHGDLERSLVGEDASRAPVRLHSDVEEGDDLACTAVVTVRA